MATQLVEQWSGLYIFLSYVMAVQGAYTGLQVVTNAKRAVAFRDQQKWIFCCATGVGACGIWTMHYIGMAALTVSDSPIQYELWTTLASVVAAIAAVHVGLSVIAFAKKPTDYVNPQIKQLLAGALFTGTGVAGMHYTGMASMRGDFYVVYDAGITVLAIIIGIVASLAGLLILFYLPGRVARTISSFVIGIAVCAMHYTAMAAMTYWAPDAQNPGMVARPGDVLVSASDQFAVVVIFSSVIRFTIIAYYTDDRERSLERLIGDILRVHKTSAGATLTTQAVTKNKRFFKREIQEQEDQRAVEEAERIRKEHEDRMKKQVMQRADTVTSTTSSGSSFSFRGRSRKASVRSSTTSQSIQVAGDDPA